MEALIRTCTQDLQARLRSLSAWPIPASTRTELRRFTEDLALGKASRGIRISESRQLKLLNMLQIPLQFLNKATTRIAPKDVERFEKALSGDQIQSRLKHRPYALNTKVDIRKALKAFLRWRLGEAEAVRLAGWIDTHGQFKTPDFLKEAEVERLFRKCRTVEQRYLVALLFDSGARAQEFLNIRVEDLQLPEGKDNFVRLTLKEEYSKTQGRTISLYWRHSLDAVRDYLAERPGIRRTDPVFGGTYDGMRMFLARLGRTVLHRHVHPHLFRHTSATFYANKLNRQELCYRYGWKFSSDMPDIYISRAGMETRQLDEKFTQTELSTLKDDLVRVTQDNQIKAQRLEELQQSLATMQQNMDMITEILAANPSIRDVEEALKRKLHRGEATSERPAATTTGES